ncbi:MAG: hypothetical protein O7G85_14760 [Planctomycetota bacterium]|nr:hypothetical protein [Planctomycetota bacterium]
MRQRFLIMLTLFLSLALSTQAFANAPSLDESQRLAVLAEAQQAYEQGVMILRDDPLGARVLFNSSADRFQLLVDDGVDNGRLFYNLANARLQANDLGQAILNYRRAQQYIPGDERVESNLVFARSLVRSRIATSGQQALLDTLFAWHHATSTQARFIGFSVCYLAFWGILFARLFHSGRFWRYPLLAMALGWIGLGISVGADLWSPSSDDDGVIVADDVVVRKGNGEGFEPQFEEPLYQGVEFEQLERRADWMQIRLPDSSTGWIRIDQAAMIDQSASINGKT